VAAAPGRHALPRGRSPRRLRLALCRRDIASALGEAHETVSRSFGMRAESGCLTVANREVEILDMALLKAPARCTGQVCDEAPGGAGRAGKGGATDAAPAGAAAAGKMPAGSWLAGLDGAISAECGRRPR
jgi:CRP/FNR family transcriptional regulator